MTRAVSLTDTICIECGSDYDTVEEAIECEILCEQERIEQNIRDEEAMEWEALTYAEEQRLVEEVRAAESYLRSLHEIEFTRP